MIALRGDALTRLAARPGAAISIGKQVRDAVAVPQADQADQAGTALAGH